MVQHLTSPVRGLPIPLGAILTAAMILRHSANLEQDAQAVELAVRKVLEQGYRTADLLRAEQPGQHVCPTQEIGTAGSPGVERDY